MNEERAEFVCPISMAVMEDPVILAETGISYERREITAWFAQGRNTCPCTNIVLQNQLIIPNRALKQAIENWNKQEEQSPRILSLRKKQSRRIIEEKTDQQVQHHFFPCLGTCFCCWGASRPSKSESKVRKVSFRRPSRAVANRMTAAIRGRDERAIKAMCDERWSFDILDDSGRGPIHWAAIADNITFVKLLATVQVNIDLKDRFGCTALHWASRLGHYSISKALTQLGSDVNAQNVLQMTPLHMAAYWGRGDIIDFLIMKGADVQALNNKRERPVDVARHSPWETAKRILPLLEQTDQ